MAKNKKGKTGGKRSTPQKQSRQSKSFARNAYDSDSDAAALEANNKSFSLKDAARNSEHPRAFFSSSSMKLRNQAMSFVPSSDPMPDRTVEEDVQIKTEHEPKQELETEPKADHTEQTRQASSSPRQTPHITPQESDSAEDNAPQIPPQATFNQSPAEKAISSATSSDDEVVFGGRSKAQSKAVETQKLAKQPRPNRSAAPSIPSSVPPTQPKADSFDPSNDFISLKLEPESSARTPNQKSKQRQNKRKRSRHRHAGPRDNDPAVQAALEDYMENMRSNGDFAGFQVDEEGAAATMDADDGTDKEGWATEDLVDFDNMSTSDEVMEAVSEVLSKRLRPSGMQYLVVREGQEIDEARWILAASLPLSAVPKVQAFEAEEEHIPEVPEDDDDSDDDSDEESEGQGKEEAGSDDASFTLDWGSDSSIDVNEALSSDDSYNDEKDLIERRMARMTDEHIARLYAKQESLGLTSDELLLFDGAEDFDLDDPIIDTKPTRSSRKRNHNRNMDLERENRPNFFASDDEMMLDGDDYGDFDPMDRDRPSLATGKGKGKSKATALDPLTFENSDSEMIDQLRSAWATDRKKKAAKKAEREELRHAGLLGRGARKGRPDLKARYAEGLSFADLESEFEDFLFGDAMQLALPPMGKRERKIIHELAHDFGLKSNSQGSGMKRFSVLYKTRRTVPFDEGLFARFSQQFERRFLPRMDGKKARGAGPKFKKGAGGGFGGKNATGYRDGEVVGRGASELGQENRGRAMLEKMGWSKGMALGTVGSGGILMPIEHIVKNSKAGLG